MITVIFQSHATNPEYMHFYKADGRFKKYTIKLDIAWLPNKWRMVNLTNAEFEELRLKARF